MQPPKGISETIYQWIVLNLALIGYLCLVLICAVLASAFSKSGEGSTTLQRVAGTLLGIILVSTLLGLFWSHFEVNPWFMAFLCSFSGVAAYKVAHWTMDLVDKSDGYVEFFGKVGRIISAARKIVNENTPTDKP